MLDSPHILSLILYHQIHHPVCNIMDEGAPSSSPVEDWSFLSGLSTSEFWWDEPPGSLSAYTGTFQDLDSGPQTAFGPPANSSFGMIEAIGPSLDLAASSISTALPAPLAPRAPPTPSASRQLSKLETIAPETRLEIFNHLLIAENSI